MYVPRHFGESRLGVLRALIAEHPLGVLRAHVARANPLWRHEGEALAIFPEPHAYITPSWYEEKARSGKVVPTFNYAVVHAHGPLRAVHDPDWLLALPERPTARHEATQPAPWRASDAPRDYIDTILAAVAGVEIPRTRRRGQWQLSQHRSEHDQLRVAAGLENNNAASQALARMMRATPVPR